MEGHHEPQIGSAPKVMGMHPSRHVKPFALPDQADAEVQVAVIGAEEDLGFAFLAGREDRFVGLAGLEAEGPDESVAEAEEGGGPAGEGEATGRGLMRGEGGGDGVAVQEVSGLVEGPERGGAGEGVGADAGHTVIVCSRRTSTNEASGRGQ